MASRSFFFSLLLFLAIASTSHALPFIYIHGIEESCSSDESIRIVSYLKESTGVEGECIEPALGPITSMFVHMDIQIQRACDEVKKRDYLRGGFNIFAISQGTLISRGLIQFCEGLPPVRNFISLAGPQAGVASIPYCDIIFGNCCSIVQTLFAVGVYTDQVQDFATAATYYKIPERYFEYLKYAKFLPKLNNELLGPQNSIYKERFSSLNKLVLLMNEDDTILIPKETAWFGYYQDLSSNRIPVPATETRLYKEDLIGLKTLNESGRVLTFAVPGDHATLSNDTMDRRVVPYLVDDAEITTKVELHNINA